MRLLITGASGFVGRHLRDRFAAEHEVWVMSRRSTGVPHEIVQDLSEPWRVDALPDGIECVIHAAACTTMTADRRTFEAVNITSTQHLVESVLRHRIPKFVLLSTGGVYGRSDSPLTEASPAAPAGLYAETKYAAEQLVAKRLTGHCDVSILRLFFPYGPGQTGRLIDRMAASIDSGDSVAIPPGSDGAILTPLFLSDLGEFIARILPGRGAGILNLAGTESISIRQLATRIGALLEKPVQFREDPALELRHWAASIDRAIALTGYRPQVDLREGLERTLRPNSRLTTRAA
jgi:nucleoside-diphosphate-sugar epimerase